MCRMQALSFNIDNRLLFQRALTGSTGRTRPVRCRRQQVASTHRFRPAAPEHSCRMRIQATAEKAASQEGDSYTPVSPESGETSRTVMDLVSHGTLSTVSEVGSPLGTYVTYVLDSKGQPVLRLRASAVHTKNLLQNPGCSLFVQPEDLPARRLARVTLLGSVTPVSEEEEETFRQKHKEVHGQAVGLDALQSDDLFYRLNVDSCFYVGGYEPSQSAETIDGKVYMGASPDPLRLAASDIVSQWNTESAQDIVRICRQESGLTLQQISYSQLMWVDRLGMYIDYCTVSGEHSTLRVAFPREVEDDRDARSILTMTAQLAWEKDRNYIPIVPPL